VPTARRRVRLGRALRHLPIAEAAWLAGDVGEAQVNLMANSRTPATEAALAADEEMLVGEAKRLRFASFVKVLGYWAQHVDPDGAAAADQARHDRRRFHLSHSFEGMWFAEGVFDAIGGAIVADELKRIDKALFDADWAKAKSRVGESVCLDDLARTPAQRRADAVVEMATRSAAFTAGARRPEPLFSVIVGYEGFASVCELADGTVVSPSSLRPWLDSAWVERVVFDGPSRVIDVGAVNGRVACGFHNRQRGRDWSADVPRHVFRDVHHTRRMATSAAWVASARRSRRSPLSTVPPSSAAATTTASTGEPRRANARRAAARRARRSGTSSSTSQTLRNRLTAASVPWRPVSDSTSTMDGTSGGHRPSRRKTKIAAAESWFRRASRLTPPESSTNMTQPAFFWRMIRLTRASARSMASIDGSPTSSTSSSR